MNRFERCHANSESYDASSSLASREARKIVVLGLVIFCVCLCATGCARAYKIKNPVAPNKELKYIVTAESPESPTGGCPGGTVLHHVRVEPGMKLVFRYSQLAKRGDNVQAPGLSTYEWTAPYYTLPANEVRFTRNDYFFLQYLLAAGEPRNCGIAGNPDCESLRFDATEQFQCLGQQIASASSSDDPRFFFELSARTLLPTFDSLSLVPSSEGCSSFAKGSAGEVRRWLAEPGLADFAARNVASRHLSVQFPGREGMIELAVYSWNSAFFNDTVPYVPNLRNNPWYDRQSAVQGARGSIDLLVPVRIASADTSEYVPIYTSVADIERRYGRAVVAIRRNSRFLGEFELEKGKIGALTAPEVPTPDGVKIVARNRFVSDNDNYFTIWFSNGREAYGAEAVLRTDPVDKADVMVAPGDVIYLGDRRFRASDRPEGER